MKRRITIEQLQELTNVQKRKLREWWTPERYDIFEKETCYFTVEYTDGKKIETREEEQDYGPYEYNMNDCLPVLDIGQCIELLGTNYINLETNGQLWTVKVWTNELGDIDDFHGNDACDALWEAVKSVL